MLRLQNYSEKITNCRFIIHLLFLLKYKDNFDNIEHLYDPLLVSPLLPLMPRPIDPSVSLQHCLHRKVFWTDMSDVRRLVGRSVCHDFLRGAKFHFHVPIRKFRTMMTPLKGFATFWEFSFYGQKKFADYEYHSLFAEKVHFHT